MKAIICDFCACTIPDVEETGIFFKVSVVGGHDRRSDDTKSPVTFPPAHACLNCATGITTALQDHKRRAREERKERDEAQ